MKKMYDGAKTKEIWARFITHQETESDKRYMDPLIWESWQRSRDYRLDPLQSRFVVKSDAAIRRLLRKKELLITVAKSYMEKLYDHISSSRFVVVITDENGVIIHTVGGISGKIQEKKENLPLKVGSIGSEEYVGTSALAVSLVVDHPVQIRGTEHYFAEQHEITCSAMTIHNAEGKIIGALSIIGPEKEVHEHTLGMVISAADGIEKEIALRAALYKNERQKEQLGEVVQEFPAGVMMIAANGVIEQYNRQAAHILRKRECLSGKNIRKVIDFDASSASDSELSAGTLNKEVYLQTNEGERVFVSLTIKELWSEGATREKQGVIWIFDLIKSLNRDTSVRGGFRARYTFREIVGESKKIQDLIEIGHRAAWTDSSVLILGESGTGKELFAQAIHNYGPRRNEPFVAINCATLPPGLIESEMFGYVGGAFTGAARNGQAGKFELADRGTVFLDEIGDMPLSAQAALLRVLQMKEIVRIGGKEPIPVDVRVIAATNHNLYEMVKDRAFREDLMYRLNVITMVLPSLKIRGKADIQKMIRHFLNENNKRANAAPKTITNEAEEALMNYDWPGNVRELQNVIERAYILATGSMIRVSDLPSYLLLKIRNPGEGTAPETAQAVSRMFSPQLLADAEDTFWQYSQQLESAEREMILAALRKAGGNISRAAKMMDISRNTIYRKARKYQIDVSQLR